MKLKKINEYMVSILFKEKCNEDEIGRKEKNENDSVDKKEESLKKSSMQIRS